MNCSKVQELLLTDYIDNELTPKLKGQVDWHLKDCSLCREFSIAVNKSAVHLFKEKEYLDAPSNLWHRIRREIAKDTKIATKHRFASFVFDIFALIPRPVLITAVIMVFVLGNFAVMRLGALKPHNVDSQSILNYLENISDFGADSPSLGTSIERDAL